MTRRTAVPRARLSLAPSSQQTEAHPKGGIPTAWVGTEVPPADCHLMRLLPMNQRPPPREQVAGSPGREPRPDSPRAARARSRPPRHRGGPTSGLFQGNPTETPILPRASQPFPPMGSRCLGSWRQTTGRPGKRGVPTPHCAAAAPAFPLDARRSAFPAGAGRLLPETPTPTLSLMPAQRGRCREVPSRG